MRRRESYGPASRCPARISNQRPTSPLDQLANGVTVETAALGTLKITIANGKVDVVGTNAPVPGITGFTATGTITDTTLSGTYEVQFDSGDPATGTFQFPIA